MGPTAKENGTSSDKRGLQSKILSQLVAEASSVLVTRHPTSSSRLMWGVLHFGPF